MQSPPSHVLRHDECRHRIVKAEKARGGDNRVICLLLHHGILRKRHHGGWVLLLHPPSTHALWLLTHIAHTHATNAKLLWLRLVVVSAKESHWFTPVRSSLLLEAPPFVVAAPPTLPLLVGSFVPFAVPEGQR